MPISNYLSGAKVTMMTIWPLCFGFMYVALYVRHPVVIDGEVQWMNALAMLFAGSAVVGQIGLGIHDVLSFNQNALKDALYIQDWGDGNFLRPTFFIKKGDDYRTKEGVSPFRALRWDAEWAKHFHFAIVGFFSLAAQPTSMLFGAHLCQC
jgi:hypothetical protein